MSYLLRILDLNTNTFNIFRATNEELVAKALDEAGLLKESTIINNILAKDLCNSFDEKRENFQEATKLGNLLIKNYVITPNQLQEALDYQKNNPQLKLGTILINFKFCTIDDIEKFLLTQIQVRHDIQELEEFMGKIARIKSRLNSYNSLIK